MSTRKEQRKREEALVEALLKEEQEHVADCVFCERANLVPAVLDPRQATLKPFRELSMCGQCYQQLLRLHKNREYARTLNTVESVKADEIFARYLNWARKLPPETLYH